MNLHEYQAKEILSHYAIAIPKGRMASTADEAGAVAREIASKKFAVKAQVHTGGRGKAGGVRIVATSESARDAARAMLGSVLVTDQSGPKGSQVSQVYVEAGEDVAQSLYVALLIDQKAGQMALVASREGGEDFEELAARNPEMMVILPLDAAAPPARKALKGFAGKLGLSGALADSAADLFRALAKAFVDLDASLIEINPLAVTEDGRLVALDVKMVLDDNALARHPELAVLRDQDDLDPVELEAQRHEVNFVRMDGDIGVAVNGAGLALATNDMLVEAGGRPANFMDIRTTATSLQISRGFDLVLKTPGLKVLLVNIHGGGMTPCDTVAEGLGISIRRTGAKLPIVLRLAGNNADFARRFLKNCGVVFHDAQDMNEAVATAVALARGTKKGAAK
ncbi:ADP-forming succinate--CoA ligase subunit beta [Breoghania sp. L-A4]|uniref:ADP-forming succinate--CoA ligase subunit beta n=1 Tax=Breoghania sp. L-A4 TaxID=2304600 RepID=UPI000E36089C|nr:ADP-forming succinate--CoA ligase subunit beta [Breoghania sp. L-A4]AXS41017.1 ADP-forming succinate--CoA ligase subunit beta [Breoghania sp. L-A4]